VVSQSVIFERQSDEGWKTVAFSDLHAGDVARMVTPDGTVLEDEGEDTFLVSAVGGSDPDSKSRFDISLDPMK
jgi:hypothetical protein